MRTKFKTPGRRLSLLFRVIQANKPSAIPVDHQSLKKLSSWASAIRNAAASSSPLKALTLYSRMQRESVPFDSFSVLFALKSCCCTHFDSPLPQNLSIISTVRHLHAHILKLGFISNVYVATCLLSAYALRSFQDACLLFDEMPNRSTVTWNVMITAYSRQGDVKAARLMFDTMPQRDIASWSAMITVYMDNALWDQGLTLSRQMLSHGHLKPDQLTLGTILSGCGRMGSAGLVLGKSIHAFAIKNEWELNVELGTCFVDMYAKCGLLKNASLVFNMMNDNNVVTWTALICGAAQHSYGRAALLIFEKMREANVKPNELTFTGVLTACVQAGLVDEGRRYFRMLKDCGLSPRIQHFGCMVDLFGKAGLLEEAYEVIKTMPFEANMVIWGSFLSSCKLHRRLELAEKVIDQVRRVVKPENDGGVYSLISDIYVLRGNWNEAERLRNVMLNQNVRKVRGSSFIRSRVL